MAEQVGAIYFDVAFETRKLLDGQKKIDQSLQQTSGRMDAFQGKVTAVASAVGVLGAALAAVRVAKMADELRLLEVRVQVAAGGLKEGAAAMLELEAISKRTQTSVAANAEVFTRLNSAMKAMGGTQAQTLALTETLAQAIKVSGASAVEAKAAMLQFGQALGSGKLAGDELRSLMESAPYLMKQMADAIGVPVGSLKKLGEEGKLTADVVAAAMLKASKQIQEDFNKLPKTFSDALTQLENAALRANKQLDEMSGASAVLAGVTRGLTDVVNQLVSEVSGLDKEAEAVGRNKAISDWASDTRVALSYLLDAADVLWQTLSVLGRNVSFVFKGIWTEIGGIGAQVAAVMRGDFEGARAIGEQMKADAAQRRAELDAADKATLSRAQTMGARMREAWARGAGGELMGPPKPQPKLKPNGGGEDGKKGAKFDEAAYLSDLRKAQASEINAINETEAEKLRVAKKHLDERKISEKAYTEAVSLISQDAEQARVELMRKTQEEINRVRKEEDEKAARERAERDKGRNAAMAGIAGQDPIAELIFQQEEKAKIVREYAQKDLEQAQLYAEWLVAIEQETQQRIQQVRADTRSKELAGQQQQLQGASQLFDSLAGMTQVFAGKQSTAYRAMFAASKAFAIAEAVVKIQQGIAQAAALPFPVNLGAMATVVASTAGIVSTIKGANYGGGRQYGGPVSAGSMYRVNETGKSEMFVGANGSQYMIPNQSGKVVSADNVGGGNAPVVQVFINGVQTAADSQSYNAQANVLKAVIADVSNQIRENSGPVWSALRSATNVQGRL